VLAFHCINAPFKKLLTHFEQNGLNIGFQFFMNLYLLHRLKFSRALILNTLNQTL